MNQKCKKWSGLLKLISLNNLTIEQLQKYDNLDDTITFIEDYIKNNLYNCEDIEKVDIPKIDKITTELVKKPVLTIEEKKERKKQYAKKYYNKNTDKIKTKSVVKAKIYYKKNTEPRKEYQRLRYGEIKKQLKKLHDIEKKL
jgi:hypothetical protein